MKAEYLVLVAGLVLGCSAPKPRALQCTPVEFALHGSIAELVPIEQGVLLSEERCPEPTAQGRQRFLDVARVLTRMVFRRDRELTAVDFRVQPDGSSWTAVALGATGTLEKSTAIATRSHGRGEVCAYYAYILDGDR